MSSTSFGYLLSDHCHKLGYNFALITRNHAIVIARNCRPPVDDRRWPPSFRWGWWLFCHRLCARWPVLLDQLIRRGKKTMQTRNYAIQSFGIIARNHNPNSETRSGLVHEPHIQFWKYSICMFDVHWTNCWRKINPKPNTGHTSKFIMSVMFLNAPTIVLAGNVRRPFDKVVGHVRNTFAHTTTSYTLACRTSGHSGVPTDPWTARTERK